MWVKGCVHIWQKRILIALCLSFTIITFKLHGELYQEADGGLGRAYPQRRSQRSPERNKVVFETSLKINLEERSRNVEVVCTENGNELLWSKKDLERNLRLTNVWDFKHDLVYCPIAKVASTAWFTNFLNLANINLEELQAMKKYGTNETEFIKKNKRGALRKIQSRKIVRKIDSPSDSCSFQDLKRMLEEMTPFLVVRHPFTRLVSAYEDKILNPRPVIEFHEKVQAEIKSRRRNDEKYKIVFPEHLLLSKQYQRWLRRKKVSMKDLQSQPSFEEFISWILKDRTNKNRSVSSWKKVITWTPFYTVCPVCQVNYTVIKLDGEVNEMNSWIESMGLDLTSSQAHTRGGAQSSSNRALDYFSQLSRDQVEELYSIYRMDFLLYSYKPDMFIKVAKEENIGSNSLERAKQDQLSQIYKINKLIRVGKDSKRRAENLKENNISIGGAEGLNKYELISERDEGWEEISNFSGGSEGFKEDAIDSKGLNFKKKKD